MFNLCRNQVIEHCSFYISRTLVVENWLDIYVDYWLHLKCNKFIARFKYI